MMAVAQIVKERPETVAVTLRGFGVGLSDLGDRLTWGECWLLLKRSAGDHATPLGAELAGWAYQASMRDLISLSAQIGDPKVSRKLMPWAIESPGRHGASEAEVAEATAELESEFIFS